MRFSHLLGQLGQFTAETAFDLAGDPELTGAESLDRAGNGQLSFLEPGNPLATTLARTGASAVLIPAQGKEAETLREIARARGLAWVALADPRLGFAEALACLFPRRRQPAGIHPQAIVSDSAVVGAGCSIGARVVIGPNCTLGERCLIQPGAVLLENVTLGNDCEIHANAVIHTGSQLGHHCVVHSTAVIGSEGFGFVPTSTGWHKMPQTGVVVLEDQVEVGCGTTIDRPCVGETRIGAGTKIDNQVHIGHDVKIGNHCVMAAQVGVAGGSQIGNHVILAGQVGIANRTSVGDRVTASSKSGLHGCIAAGSVVSGYPAIEHKLWLRCVAIFSKLPQLSRAVKARQ